jgi:sulfatase maturation enzyme AslB (radical SAM superfamily)
MHAAAVPLTVESRPLARLSRAMTDAEVNYTNWLTDLRRKYLRYPMLIGLETLARCNAKCHFCPYPGMERKGERMSDELIAKVLNDLTDIPADLPFRINFTRVNEPFLTSGSLM